jgi:hypothetical protein
VASNSNTQAPFLIYLTVFKARLGIANIVLPLASFAYQPGATLTRAVRQHLAATVPLRVKDPANSSIFHYLLDKNVIGATPRREGRYKDYCLTKNGSGGYSASRGQKPITELPVFQTDLWMAHPALPSTIGVPTPENTEELLEFCFQLGLLTRTKNTWTAAGQMVAHLRRDYPTEASDNPFLLGLEAMGLLRQFIDRDGLLIRELLRELLALPERVPRDDIAARLERIAARAVSAAEALRLPSPVVTEGKRFVRLLKSTTAKYKQSGLGKTTRGPGVLEHRTSPRLEWLTDLGVLSKDGLPKNGFEYRRTSDARLLFASLDRHAYGPTWADQIALDFWRFSNRWGSVRSTITAASQRSAIEEAFRRGYQLLQRSVGPAPIREVCFAAALLRPGDSEPLEWYTNRLIEWATSEPEITLSGGRYTRRPELVHMTPTVLKGHS